MSDDTTSLPPVPPVIYAKVHGASIDVLTGQLGLSGGWREYPRDGHVAMVPKAQADDLRQALSDVAGILTLVTKGRSDITEETRFTILEADRSRTLSVKDALDAADAALEQSGGPV